jgi:hypothetical protein
MLIDEFEKLANMSYIKMNLNSLEILLCYQKNLIQRAYYIKSRIRKYTNYYDMRNILISPTVRYHAIPSKKDEFLVSRYRTI